MANQLGGGDGAGFSDIVAAMAPLALLAAPRNSQAPQMLALLANLSRGREAQEERERERARAATSAGAMARIFGDAGLQVDPSMTGSDMAHTVNAQIALGNAKRAQEIENRKAKDDLRAREVFGSMAGVQSRIGSELPETLTADLAKIAPEVGRSAELKGGYADTAKSIRESAKNLEIALGVGRQRSSAPGPGGYVPEEQLVADEGTFPGGAFRVGKTGRVAVPAAGLAEVPSNVFAFQRQVAQTGKDSDKDTAEGISKMFNIPLPELTGGAEAQRVADKPPEGSFTHFATDDKGTVTPITVTGRRSPLRHEPIPGVGKTKRDLASPTETTSTRTTAARPIRDPEELKKITAAFDSLVADVAGNNEDGEPNFPGFTDPKRSVIDGPSGLVPKTKVLEEAFRRRHGTQVTVQWNGKKFVVVRAWEPGQELETTTTRGPAPRGSDAEEK